MMKSGLFYISDPKNREEEGKFLDNALELFFDKYILALSSNGIAFAKKSEENVIKIFPRKEGDIFSISDKKSRKTLAMQENLLLPRIYNVEERNYWIYFYPMDKYSLEEFTL